MHQLEVNQLRNKRTTYTTSRPYNEHKSQITNNNQNNTTTKAKQTNKHLKQQLRNTTNHQTQIQPITKHTIHTRTITN